MTFHNLVDEAVKHTYLKDFGVELVQSLGQSNFVREFGTVHINIGRRVGKTTWIKNNARACDLIIVPNVRCKEPYYYKASDVKTVSELELEDDPFNLTNYNWIFIDEPALCGKSAKTSNWFHKCKFTYDSIVIMLGE